MRYQNVCIEAFGYTLPEVITTSAELEARLGPLYRRTQLTSGMLEGMYGVRDRRFWAPGTLPSTKSVESAEKLIRSSGIETSQIGALIHGSVCRDYTEPATACVVHHALCLSQSCLVFDVSNACLGILTGMVQLANMIEVRQIEAGIVVGSECSRRLVETTIEILNSDTSLSRAAVNRALASLTTGSASVAALLVHRDLSRTNNRLLAVMARCNSAGYHLCRSGYDESIAGDVPHLMETNSGPLVEEGIKLTTQAFDPLLKQASWAREEVDKTICHQVGARPRKLMLQALGANPATDLTTFETLGNTGAVAIPLTMAIAIERGQIQPQERVAWLGNGSGVNSLLLAIDWQRNIERVDSGNGLCGHRRAVNAAC